jgi:antitoxin component HigA of HigAB toxin-antitoxin module
LQQAYPDQLPLIHAEYLKLLEESNENEKLVVLFHDAMTMIENPPEMSIVDLKYFELMTNIVVAMEKAATIIKDTKPANPIQFIIDASKGKWTNKEATWGYKYMEARGLI